MLEKLNKYLDAILAHSVHYVHLTASYELNTHRGGAHNDKDTEYRSYKIKSQYSLHDQRLTLGGIILVFTSLLAVFPNRPSPDD